MNSPQVSARLKGITSDLKSAIGQIRAQFRLRLSTKVALIVTGITLLGVLVSSFLLENRQRENLISNAEQTAIRLDAPITASLEPAGDRHDFLALQQRLGQAAGDAGADRIRILNLGGQVIGSSSAADVGLNLTSSSGECLACHASSQSSLPSSALITRDGSPVLLTVNPLSNQPRCQSCHGSQPRILGLLMIDMPMGQLDSQLRESYIEIAQSALLTFVLLVGLMIPLLRRYLTRPIEELTREIAELGTENLDYRVQVKSDDELGTLADGLENMRQQLLTSRLEMERRNRELALLNDVALAANEYLDLDQVLHVALDTVMNRLRMKTGHIFLLNQLTGQFDSVASRGLTDAQLAQIAERRGKKGADFVQEVVNTNQVVYWPDISANPALDGLFGQDSRRSFVNVPLRAKQSVVGTLVATTTHDVKLSYRELATLEAVGHEIGTAIENALLLDKTKHDQQVTSQLYQLGTEISSSLVLPDVLNAIARSVRTVLQADVGAVGLLNDAGSQISFEAVYGADKRLPAEFAISVGPGTWGTPLAHNKPITLPLTEASQRNFEARSLLHVGMRSLVAVPLWQGGKLYGALAAISKQPRAFGESDLQSLGHLAHRGAVAVENARLHNQVRHLATLEERDRLAREIHDNLAQALVYLNLRTSITRDALQEGRLGEAIAGVGEIQELIKQAYTDTREAIFNLRATSSLGAGLIPALRDYLSEYASHYGVKSELIVDVKAELPVPTHTGIEVMRIIQEAVTNIRKHSGSRLARIRLAGIDHHLSVSIEDQGLGFDTQDVLQPDSQHVGVQIMRERAEGIGGQFEIDSAPGKGTRIRVKVPLS